MNLRNRHNGNELCAFILFLLNEKLAFVTLIAVIKRNHVHVSELLR